MPKTPVQEADDYIEKGVMLFMRDFKPYEAIKAFKESINILPTWSGYFNLTQTQKMVGQIDEAVESSFKTIHLLTIELGRLRENIKQNYVDNFRQDYPVVYCSSYSQNERVGTRDLLKAEEKIERDLKESVECLEYLLNEQKKSKQNKKLEHSSSSNSEEDVLGLQQQKLQINDQEQANPFDSTNHLGS